MAEESPLQKMLSKYNKYITNLEWHIKTNQPWDADIVQKRISDFKEVVADIKAALGWVKVESEKDLPEGIVLYEIDVNTEHFKTTNYHRFNRDQALEDLQKGFKLRYLSETTLPSVEGCMEYAGKAFDAGYKNGWHVSAFGNSNGQPNREEYLKSIKKD